MTVTTSRGERREEGNRDEQVTYADEDRIDSRPS